MKEVRNSNIFGLLKFRGKSKYKLVSKLTVWGFDSSRCCLTKAEALTTRSRLNETVENVDL